MAEDDSLHDPTPYSELMTSIISRFKVEEVIQAAVDLIEYLTTLPFSIPASGLECPEIKVNLTSIDLRNLHYFVSYFVNRMFSSQDFLHGQLAQVRVIKICSLSEINLRIKHFIIKKKSRTRKKLTWWLFTELCCKIVLNSQKLCIRKKKTRRQKNFTVL